MFKKISTLLLVLLCFSVPVFFLINCDNDDGDDEVQEFVADADDFSGYKNWERVDYTVYPAFGVALGGAHMANDSNYVRMTYKKPAGRAEQEMGTILVKETFKWDGDNKVYAEMGGLLAMAKRGGNFNTEHSGWEWFMLNPTNANIADRGAGLLDNGCNNCHSPAPNDYVFEHPTEYVLPQGDEADWFEDAHTHIPLWDSNVEPDDFIGQAHGVTEDFVRSVYKWQPGAVPSNETYPIGTIIIKRLTDPDTGEMPEVGGAITAMVKRGKDFNPDHGNWEWFMRSPEGEYMRGAGDPDNSEDLFNMCNNCHSNFAAAGGVDYVFPHD